MSSFKGISSPISPDEIRGRETLRKAVQEAEERAERKRAMVRPQVQDEIHDFYAGTDGIYFSGVKIQVHPRDHKRIINLKKRIEEMEALDFDEEIIKFWRRKLRKDLTYLLAASYRAQKRLEVADHREEEAKPKSLGDKALGVFGLERAKKPEKEVTVVVPE